MKMRKRLLSFIVGRPGLLRNCVMCLMCLLRRKWLPSQLQPDYRFVRTLQSPHHLVFHERSGRYEISSQAFGPSSSDETLSGDLEEVLLSDGLKATAMYPAVRDAVGAASVTVRQILDTKATVEHDPVIVNWYHGAVRGTKSKSVKRRLSQAAQEIIPIDQQKAAELEKAWQETRKASSS
ncbi:hypothetical protein [Bradyrhizobium sp. HKCCYLR1023]|uniref:hypothetical protein n=1 Tax=Bradyrhizobium TaxID=374 RepID=UPI003EBC8D75